VIYEFFSTKNGGTNQFGQTGEINFSEADQAKLAFPRAAVLLGKEQDCTLSLKLSRGKMISAIKNASQIPLPWQEILLAEIAAIDVKHDLLRLDFIRHAHGVGVNFTGTIKEV
jgi:hypothetical protein